MRFRSQLIKSAPNPSEQQAVQLRSQTTTAVAAPVARRKISKYPWLQSYLDSRPDFNWLYYQHPFKRNRSWATGSLIGWIHPEGFPFIYCGIFNITFAVNIYLRRSFFTDPETSVIKLRNRGYLPNAYRPIDEVNGFQTPDDVSLPWHVPQIAPIHFVWVYSKRYLDPQAARAKWLKARKTKWEQIERPKLVQQAQEMEAMLGMQQQQQQQEENLEAESLEIESQEEEMPLSDTSSE